MKNKNLFLFPIMMLLVIMSCQKFDESPETPVEDISGSQLKSASEDAGYFPTFQLFHGISNAECDAKIDAMVYHFFDQSSANRIYYEVNLPGGTPGAYIHNVGDDDVRSEGMSYGMMITVQLDMKSEFDRLWNWVKYYMKRDDNYFRWALNKDNGSPITDLGGGNPAPDGEEYFAMALYFAYNRWGEIQYKNEADAILNAMLNNPIPAFGSNNLICFQPHREGNYDGTTFTDPSYHIPTFYDLFAEYGPSSQRSRWQNIAAASRDFLKTTIYKQTNGLVPDFSDWSGNPYVPANLDAGHRDFRYDAWRVAMNVSLDCTFFPEKSTAYSPPNNRNWYIQNLLSFFESKEGEEPNKVDYPDRYVVATGQSIGTDHSTGLVAANCFAARSGNSYSQSRYFAEELWDAQMPSGQWRYYNGCLYMLSMLFSTGNYNIIDQNNTIRQIIYVPNDPVSNRFTSAWSGKQLTATNTQDNAAVKGQPEHSDWSSQDWTIEPIAGTDYCRIKNVWTEKYLNVPNQNENAKIVCYTLHEDWLSQQWIMELVPQTSNTYRIKNAWTGKYITIENTGNYAKIKSQSLNMSWASQKWVID